MNPLRRFLKWLPQGVAGVKEGFDKYPLFWVALPVSLYVLFGVPQINNLLQFPPLEKEVGLLLPVWVGYFTFVALLLAYYLASLVVVMRRFPVAWVEESVRRRLAAARARWQAHPGRRFLSPNYWVVEWLSWPPELAARLLLSLVSYPHEKPGVAMPEGALSSEEVTDQRVLGRRAFLTVALALVGAAVMFFYGAVGDSSKWYPLGGAICRSLALLLSLFVLWAVGQVLAGAVKRRAADDASTYVTRLGRTVSDIWDRQWPLGVLGTYQIRVLSWALVGALAGEVLWVLGYFQALGGAFSYRLYTIWAVVHLLSLVIILTLLVDRWHNHTVWPFRIFALVGLLGGVGVWWGAQPIPDDDYLRHLTPDQAAQLAPGARAAAQGVEWFAHLEKRLATIPEDSPVVLVAASGGGSRAAVFTALALDTLDRTPVDPAKPLWAGETRDPEERAWGDNVLLVSSVSGGSLATAYQVQRQLPFGDPRRANFQEVEGNLRHTTEAELVIQLRQHLLREIGSFAGASAAAPVDNLDRNKLLALQAGEAYAGAVLHHYNAGGALGTRPATTDPEVRRCLWVLRSRAFDAMCTDFMAPILRGSLTPALDRGNALARFWTEHYGWHNSTNASGYGGDVTQSNYGAHHPAVVFNASDVLLGSRLAVGFPPLPDDLWQARDLYPPHQGRPRTFGELDPGRRLSLARAVRLSSNFPWGFRAQEFPWPTGGPKRDRVHVLDGGVVDNTGLDTLYEVFRALEHYARDEQRATPYHAPAARILAGLRRRGVVILEIDSGAKPSNQLPRGPLAGLTEPGDALSNAAYTNAEQVKKLYVEEIIRTLTRVLDRELAAEADRVKLSLAEYRERLPDTATVMHIPFQCNHYDASGQTVSSDVMTAWSLGPGDKAEVLARFLIELRAWDTATRRKIERGMATGRALYDDLVASARKRLRHDLLALAVKEAEAEGEAVTQGVRDLGQRLNQVKRVLNPTEIANLRPDVDRRQEQLRRLQGQVAALEKQATGPENADLRPPLARLRQDFNDLNQKLADIKDEKVALAVRADELARRLAASANNIQESFNVAQHRVANEPIQGAAFARDVDRKNTPKNLQKEIYREAENRSRAFEKRAEKK